MECSMDITVYGFKPTNTYEAISSKSYVHRLLIAAALSDGEVRIRTNVRSEDMEATANCLRAMGAQIRFEDGAYCVKGLQGELSGPIILDCGESGSTERFLLPLALHLCGEVTFTGRGRLPMRPLDVFLEVLEKAGASFTKLDNNAALPLTAKGSLKPGNYEIAGNVSSQYITGLLFALPLLEGDSFIRLTTPLESAGYTDITLDVLARFGIEVEKREDGFFVKGDQRYTCEEKADHCGRTGQEDDGWSSEKNGRSSEANHREPFTIFAEGDWSNAAPILSIGALRSKVAISGLNKDSVQGDARILDVIRQFGAKVSVENGTFIGHDKCKSDIDSACDRFEDDAERAGRKGLENDIICVEHDRLEGVDADVSQIPDLVPTLAVLALYSSSESIFRNVGRLRLKESDRVESVKKLVETFGGRAETIERDGVEDLKIIPRSLKNADERLEEQDMKTAEDSSDDRLSSCGMKKTITMGSLGDHRIVMALALASEAEGVPVRITGAEAINKSFPGFFDLCVTDSLPEAGQGNDAHKTSQDNGTKQEVHNDDSPAADPNCRCIVVCAGPDDGNIPDPRPGDLVIAADAGYFHAKRCGIVPDIVVGDFDSMTDIPPELQAVIDSGRVSSVETKDSQGIEPGNASNEGTMNIFGEAGTKPLVVKLNPIKDDTDTVSAIKLGLERGCRRFEIYFAAGGRTAHTLANIQCLKFIKDRGGDGIICDKKTIIRLLKNEAIEFDEDFRGYISVFALGRAKCVDIKGLKYEVSDAALDNGFPLGVSNEFVGQKASVSVRDGELLVLHDRK